MLRLLLIGYLVLVGVLLGVEDYVPAPLLEDDFTDTGVGCVDDCLEPMED